MRNLHLPTTERMPLRPLPIASAVGMVLASGLAFGDGGPTSAIMTPRECYTIERDWVRPTPEADDTFDLLDGGFDFQGLDNSLDLGTLYAVGEPLSEDPLDNTAVVAILSSDDQGEDWNVACSLDSAFSNLLLFDVVVGESNIVAVGDTGNVVVLGNDDCGVLEAPAKPDTDKFLFGVATNGTGIMIAAAQELSLFRSTDDGETWGQKVFPGLGDPILGQGEFRDVAWGDLNDGDAPDPTFVAVGRTLVGLSEIGVILYNTQGGIEGEWKVAGALGDITDPLFAVAANGDRFVAVGRGGAIWTSTDGASWTKVPSADVPTDEDLFGVHYDEAGGIGWVVVGAGTVVLVSEDGLTWAQEAPPVAGQDPTPATLNAVSSTSVLEQGARVVAVGNDAPFDRTDPAAELDLGTVVRSESTSLCIDKTDDPDPLQLWLDVDEIGYTITVENTGNVALENVTVTDTLPPELHFDSDNNGDLTCAQDPDPDGSDDDQIVVCNGAVDASPGEMVSAVFNTALDSDVETLPNGTILTNEAFVAADQITATEDCPNGKCPITEDTYVEEATPQTAVFKECFGGPESLGSFVETVNPGGVMTCLIDLALFAGEPGKVKVTETYPENTVFVDAYPLPTEGNNVWVVDLVATDSEIPDFVDPDIRVGLRVKDGVNAGTILTNKVVALVEDCFIPEAYGPNGDQLNECSSSDTDSVTVAWPEVDLYVDKTDRQDPIPAGGAVTYDIVLRNQTTDASSTSCVLVDTYPANWTFESATGPVVFTHDAQSRTVTWQLGALPQNFAGAATVTLGSPVDAATGDMGLNNVALSCVEGSASAIETTTIGNGPGPDPEERVMEITVRPRIAGEENTIEATGGFANQPTSFFWGVGAGPATIDSCDDAATVADSYQPRATDESDDAGNASASWGVPAFFGRFPIPVWTVAVQESADGCAYGQIKYNFVPAN